jgi:hypothetical protein
MNERVFVAVMAFSLCYNRNHHRGYIMEWRQGVKLMSWVHLKV